MSIHWSWFDNDFKTLYSPYTRCSVKNCENFVGRSGKSGLTLSQCGRHTSCSVCKKENCWSDMYCFYCDPNNK